MSIHGRIAVSFLVPLVTALVAALPAAAQKKPEVNPAPEFIPGQYLVRLRTPGIIGSSAIQALEEKAKGKVLRVHENQNFVLLQKPLIQSAEGALMDIQSTDDVLLVEPNYVYRVNKTANDPDLGKLWGIRNSGQQDSSRQAGVAGIDVDAERAWDITTGSKDVVVAVIDTGVDYRHPDLAANAWVNEAELNGKPGVDDDGNGFVDDVYGASFADPAKPTGNPMDDHGHGTHCAGTIGAKGDDGRGIVGVSWDVRIMGVKFLGADGSGSLEGAIQAIDYATRMGARIQSNSWAGGGYSKLLEEAIQRADAANVLFIAASSNSGGNNDASPVYPATYNVPNIISVAAIDNRGTLADFSNYGRTTVHVAAPGVNIHSSLPGSAYDSWSGTSMATPHVSGVAALLVAHDAYATHYQLRQRILDGARPLAGLRGKVSTGGVVNAYYSLTGQAPPEDPNDPAKWLQQSANFSTPHPYVKKELIEWELSIPGATQMALYFSKFQTERTYDTLTLKNRAGQTIAVLSGSMDDSFSPIIAGDYVKLIFKSDDSIEKYGIDITGVAFR
ncbi:MAG: S8 family serine peptidase [Bdellovibrionaceae bacterium]|nr:S8 family serine peptidase [Pseudobdellovibrionaceae bacterium]